MYKRFIRLSLVVISAILASSFLMQAVSGFGSYKELLDVGAILEVFSKIGGLLIVFAFLLLLFFTTHFVRPIAYSTLRKVSNLLVYLHASALCLPWGGVPSFLPNGPRVTTFLFSLLFLIVVVQRLSPGSVRPRPRTSKAFRVIVSWFLLSSVIGIVVGIMGLDSVRANLPLWPQFQACGLLGDAFLVYYVIETNKWQQREFEILFRIILWLGVFIAFESLLAFYAGFKFGPSLTFNSHFSSMFIGRHYYAGILGISVCMLSAYFWQRSRSNGVLYAIIFVLGSLLLFSTMARNILVSFVLSIGFLGISIYRYSVVSSKRSYMRKATVITFLCLLLPFFGYTLIETTKKIRTDLFDPTVLFGRGYRHARALDVLLEKPLLGTGFGLTSFYSHSSVVPPRISAYFEKPKIGRGFFTRKLIFTPDQLYDSLPLLETTHSLFYDFVVGLGVFGLICVVYIFWRGWRMLLFFLAFGKRFHTRYNCIPLFSILALTMALCLVVQTTSKFQSYWYFSLLFGYIQFQYSELKKKYSFQKIVPSTPVIGRVVEST